MTDELAGVAEVARVAEVAEVAGVAGVAEVAGGEPSPEQLAAIVAAIEVLWPQPPAAAPAAEAVSIRWRMSGRWWSRPTISRRDRPWVGPAS